LERRKKLKAQEIVFSGVILFFFFSNLVLSSQGRDPQKIDDLISLIKQKSGLEIQLDDQGWEWRQEDSLGTFEQGEMTFSDSKWLMYLIHWGPIQVQKLTEDYVKERMLGMWGVKFEIS